MLQNRFRFDCGVLTSDDREADAFAEPRIGDRECGGPIDCSVSQRQGFDARRVDITAAADDDILLSADDPQIASLVHPT